MDKNALCKNCYHYEVCPCDSISIDNVPIGTCGHYVSKESIESLTSENKSLKRKIFGLETTLSHMKEKEMKRYKELGWNDNGNA